MSDYTEKPKSTDTCVHGNFPPCEICQNTAAGERKENIAIGLIDPADKQAVADYYQFEVDQGSSTINPKTTFEGMVNFRQTQLRDGKLTIAVAKEGGKIVSTGVVVLENGALGRELQPNEAGAGGVVVDKDKRNTGIGEMMAKQQIQMARDGGKESIVSHIDKGNDASFRLHLKLGYQLESIRRQPGENDEKKVDFKIRHNLEDNFSPVDWAKEVSNQRLSAINEITPSSPGQILIASENDQLIQQALEQGYQGVYLLRPTDFEDSTVLDKNYLVFTK